jgi:glycosyltransferase involved in cell wall biosynthesis
VQNSSAIHYQELEQLGMGSIFEYQPHTEDVTGKMKEAHCIVLPSYREGLPRTLLEASAMGRVVVATDVEGCREVVQNGRTGFLCAVKSVGSLQDALEKVLELPPERMLQMGHAGRKFVQENFAELTVFKIIFENLNRVI